MNQEPLVSIITPCYNVEKYVAQAINSIFSQTYTNWELIIVDDCSTDATVEIISELVRGNPKVKFIRNEVNFGSPARVRNLAFCHMKGEFIAFLDSDDMWMSDKLALQVSRLVKTDHCLCYSGGVTIGEDGKFLNHIRPSNRDGYMFSALLKNYEINIQSVLLRVDCLKSLDMPKFNENLVIAEDYELFMRLASKYSVCSIGRSLFKYRISSGSLTNTRFDLFASSLESALNNIVSTNDNAVCDEKEYRYVYAKINYYKALSAKKSGSYFKPIFYLKKYCFLEFRYLSVFLLAFAPKFIWVYAHRVKRKT